MVKHDEDFFLIGLALVCTADFSYKKMVGFNGNSDAI
jgi:hypothetical protein